MNIVFFGWVKACDPMRVGGCESVIRRLAVALSHRGHTVAVVMYGADRVYTVDEFFGHQMTLMYRRSFAVALRELRRLKCSVVVETYVHKRYYAMYLAFKSWNVKMTKFSAIVMADTGSSVKRWLCTTFRAKSCSTVFAVSPNSVKRLQDSGVPAVWLPPPVPDYYFSCARRSSGGNKVVISFLGRIDPNKGLHELCSAFEALSQESHLLLRIKGYYSPENPESVTLHRRLEGLKGIDYAGEPHSSCVYTPPNEHEVLRYLSETDILVLPYRNLKGTLELPLLVFEGLAAGCVVVSSDVGDISEIVGVDDWSVRATSELQSRLREISFPGRIESERKRLRAADGLRAFKTTNVVEVFLNHL